MIQSITARCSWDVEFQGTSNTTGEPRWWGHAIGWRGTWRIDVWGATRAEAERALLQRIESRRILEAA